MATTNANDRHAQDERVEKLWRTLDTRKEGHLDARGLKQGLKKIDHPLKNADDMLQDVLKAVDTDGDGHIQYSEFRTFVNETEKALLKLFESIDRDHNGQLDKSELKSAFTRAGLTVSNSKLDQFFTEVDTNKDGVISFEEWRDFLLFIPASTPNLRAVLSYYTSTANVNAEGDVHVSDEAAEGIGRRRFHSSFVQSLVATFLGPPRRPTLNKITTPRVQSEGQRSLTHSRPLLAQQPKEDHLRHDPEDVVASGGVLKMKSSSLTDLCPRPGYFLAGGLAGVISRTATAPLDRLKVYLIAQTSVKNDALTAVKSGAPIQAAKHASRPLVDASKLLWRMGGIRSLFAGNGLNVIKVMPESAIKFGSYEASKQLLARVEGHGDPKALHPWTQFLAAGLGGMISQFAAYPLDTLKFRMQCETVEGGLRGNKLISTTAQKLWKQNGLRAFYRGLPLGLVGMFPYSAIDLTTYEYTKRFVIRYNMRKNHCQEKDAQPGNFVTAFMGAFSASFGASVVYPLNLLRTRLQSQGTASHPPTYTGFLDVTAKTIKGEGVRGLFKGLTPNLLKVAPAMSISYVVYDNSKRLMGLS
ncbi:MAG: hypothetical protein LQ348_002746 [Seirophora lacunosa]|nr:MAG: hypothetical protein LQ344_005684 [Seirophora lacunosa]KAI4193952.1 MAG: hypothetical protein LQ348_002746 [Seirophora lacunosa]